MVHVYAALAGMFLLLRKMTLGRAAAVFGALSFGMGGLLFGSMTMLPTFFVWALAPLVAWAVLRVLVIPSAEDGSRVAGRGSLGISDDGSSARRPSDPRPATREPSLTPRIAVAALLAGMQLLIGEPMALMQVWLLIATGALVFARRRTHLLIPILVLAVLIAAVEFIPAHRSRAQSPARSRGMAYSVVRGFSMPPVRPLEIAVPHLFGVFDPFTGGYWGASLFNRNAPYLYSIYNGIGVAILALAGFLLRARGARTVAVVGIVSYVLAIGDRTPLLHFFYATGIARGLRYPEKFAAMGIVAIAIFAATIADRLLTGDVVARRAALIAAAIVTAVSAALVVWSLTPSSFLSRWQSLARTEWLIGLAFAATAAALLFALPHMQRRHWLLLAFMFVLADITLLANEIATRMPKPFFSPPDIVASLDPDHHDYAVMHRGNWIENTNKHELRARYGPWMARNGLEPFTPASWGLRSALELDFDETALLPTHDLLDAMMSLGNSRYARWAESFAAISNVRYLIDYRSFVQVLSEQTPLAHARVVRLTHLASTGRYYFPQQIVEADSPADVVTFMKTTGIQRPIAFVPAGSVWVRALARGHIGASDRTEVSRVLHVDEHANSAVIDVESPSPALLVATVTRHKYWSATIDGQSATLVPVNIAYQGILVPAGRHRIEMRYRNPVVIWSGVVSALAVIACFATIATAPLTTTPSPSKRILNPASSAFSIMTFSSDLSSITVGITLPVHATSAFEEIDSGYSRVTRSVSGSM